MNQEIQDDQDTLAPWESDVTEQRDTVGLIVNVLLKVGAGYLAKVIIEALGF